MRALILVVLLAGCAGLDPTRGGWYVFGEPSSCRDCGTTILHHSEKGVFDTDASFPLDPNHRISAYYEHPIPAGVTLRLAWSTPIPAVIELREPAGDSWTTREDACAFETSEPTPTPSPTPMGSALGSRTCVWTFTTQGVLDAPNNGIAMLWRIDNRGSHPGNVTFAARLDTPPGS